MRTHFIFNRIFLLFLFIPFYGRSQPVLLSTERAQVGDKFYNKNATLPAIIDTSEGVNQTWNYSQLLPVAFSEGCTEVIDPANSPYFSNYPNSNYATLSYPDTFYSYSRIGNIYAELLGNYRVGAGFTTYLNTLIYNVFPLQYGSTFTDVYSTAVNTFSLKDEVIGTGTLILPNRTFNDVLLTKRYYYFQNDSVRIYNWLDSDNGISLLSYIPSQVVLSESIIYLSGSSISVEENLFSADVSFCNPVENVLRVTISCQKPIGINYSLLNIEGKNVYTGKLDPEMIQKIELDLSLECSGIYLLCLMDNSGRTKRLKVLKY